MTSPTDSNSGTRDDDVLIIKWMPIVVPLGALLIALCVFLIDWAVL